VADRHAIGAAIGARIPLGDVGREYDEVRQRKRDAIVVAKGLGVVLAIVVRELNRNDIVAKGDETEAFAVLERLLECPNAPTERPRKPGCPMA
jgi:hypothetical protein